MLGQDTGSDLVDLADELEHWVVGKVLGSEFALSHVAGIGLAEDSMAVAWYDLARLQGRPEIVCDGFVAQIATDGFLHLL